MCIRDSMNFTRSVVLALKGCAMGMADVVPGVSGGTIAFISGIYEELLDSIRSVNATALKLLLKLRLGEFWRHINGSFLLPVLLGIAVAIFSLARLMTYLLQHHPIEIWSFFFGLIIASALLVARQVGRWDWRSVLSFAVGAVAAWWITVATPTETPNDWWFVMLSGAIAICAMILPGISGAFILLLLGKYQYIMQAVGDLNIPVICYGLRADFSLRGFPGSTRLLELAHTIEEMKTICTCGRKAICNCRRVNGRFVFEGEQVAIDLENDVQYVSMCPQCYFKAKRAFYAEKAASQVE